MMNNDEIRRYKEATNELPPLPKLEDKTREVHEKARKKGFIRKNVRIIKNLFTTKEKAHILSKDGLETKQVDIPSQADAFSFEDEKYVMKRHGVTKIYVNKLFDVEIHYFFQRGIPEPLLLGKEIKPRFISSKDFNIMLETKVLQDLNKLSNNFLGGLNWKMVLMVVGAVVIGGVLFL